MKHLAWRDGFSVGVKAIDNDHKLLIQIISELADAIAEKKPKQQLDYIFAKLENYVTDHFAREEALMQACHYDRFKEHSKEHREFTSQLHHLKSLLSVAPTPDAAQEVYLYLHNWLITHILDHDLSFAPTALAKGFSDVETLDRTQQGWTQIANLLARRIPLLRRILLTSFLPFVGLVYLGFLLLTSHQDNLKFSQQNLTRFSRFQSNSQLLQQLNHHRILMLLEKYPEPLPANIAPDRIFAFNPLINKWRDDYLLPLGLKNQSQGLMTLNANLDEIAQRSTGASKAEDRSNNNKLSEDWQIFQQTTEQLLIEMGQLSFWPDSRLSVNLKLLQRILAYQNSIVEEIYLGVAEDLSDQFQQQNRQKQHLAQRLLENQIIALVDPDQKNQWEIFELHYLVKSSNMPVEPFNPKAVLAKYQGLSQFLDLMQTQVAAHFKKERENLQLDWLRFSIPLALLMLITFVSIYLLNRSIRFPIQLMAKAMNKLAKGDYGYRLLDQYPKDELANMARAYEYTRRHLMHNDLQAASEFLRKDMVIAQKNEQKDYYEVLATTDPLTGVFNRRRFFERGKSELARCERYQHPLSLMMLDIDHFKRVNDTYGHAVGDIVLKAFCQACTAQVRATDTMARIGGEEFAILLPEASLEQAHQLAERIRIAIENLEVVNENHKIHFTVSIGLSEWSPQNHSIEALLEVADRALYQAKQSGRNRVCGYSA